MKYIIQDWAGNVCFYGKEFGAFASADIFLTQWIERTYPDTVENDERYAEERGEYYIVEKQRVRESKYLEPNDPRAGLKHDEGE